MSAETIRAFGAYGPGEKSERSWLASLAASSVIYVAIAAAVVTFSAAKTVIEKKNVELTFVEKVMKEPPPPPPPPPAPVVKPEAPAAMAPAVRPDQKIRKLDKPPPPKELVAPKEMPKAKPKEADPSEDKGIAVYGEPGKGDPAGLEGGLAQGGSLGGQVGGAIALPEDGTPPVPDAGNRKPDYPQEAKASGKQGTVVLKVYILADGRVAKVEVMRGEEPFVGAALAAVKNWRFEPARYKGQAITIYQVITIPFRLTA